MASKQLIFLTLFGAILCSSLFDIAAAQNDCVRSGGRCVRLPEDEDASAMECPPGEERSDEDCDTDNEMCCVRSPPMALSQECREEGGRCMRECRNGTMPDPDIDCPRGGECCMPSSGGPSLSRRGPPSPPRRGRPTPPPKRRRPSPPPTRPTPPPKTTTMPPPVDDWMCMQAGGECKWRCRDDETELRNIYCPMMGRCCV